MDQIVRPKDQNEQSEEPQENPFLSAVEGYYSGAILDGLYRSGILTHLEQPLTVAELASASDTDVRLLAPLLAYLCSTGECLIHDPADQTYRVHPSFFKGAMPAHLLDQYVGAYGPCIAALDVILQKPSSGGDYIDRTRHAAAFAKASGAPRDLVDLILRVQPGTVLDLGCGSAGLLRQLVKADPEMCGIGIDMNAEMLELARKDAKETAERLQFHTGDVLNVAEGLPADTRDGVDIIVAQSLANEFFAERTIDDFLGRLSAAFPDRLLILADYYGSMGKGVPIDLVDQRRGALHDIAQVLSGQGIPPGSLEDWQVIYERTGCTLLKASSVVSGGLTRFIHIVKV